MDGGMRPTLLTKDYIKTALQHDKSTSNIISMKINMPVAKGNNYNCLIFKMKINYKIKDENDLNIISLIIKSPDFRVDCRS